MIVSVNFTTNIIDATNKMLGNFITTDPNNTLGQSLVKGIPGVYVLTVLIVALVIAVKASKGWIGYNEKEKEYLKTQRLENRKKVRDFATKYNIPVVGWLVRERGIKENKVIESKGG
jgi:cytochrome c-type biogenesis protein CcmH/NrfF